MATLQDLGSTIDSTALPLAEDPAVPLVERVALVARLAEQLDHHRPGTPAETEQLAHLVARCAACFRQDLQPALAAAGIHLATWETMPSWCRGPASEYFLRAVFPLLVPLAVDATHPFPRVLGRSLNLAIVVRNPTTGRRVFVRIEIPSSLPRFVRVGPRNRTRAVTGRTDGCWYLPVEDLITAHLDELFRETPISEQHLFRVVWGGGRLEVSTGLPSWVVQLLLENLAPGALAPLRISGRLGLAALDQIHRELRGR